MNSPGMVIAILGLTSQFCCVAHEAAQNALEASRLAVYPKPTGPKASLAGLLPRTVAAHSCVPDTEEIFRAVFERCYPKVTAYARRRVHADAVEDVVADVFAVVWRRWEDVPKGEATLSWVYGVAKQIILRHHRSESRRLSLLARVASMRRTEEPATADLVSDDRVGGVLGELRPGDREVLLLRYWEDLSVPEIASALRKSAPSVSLALHRARERFRVLWEQMSPDEGPSPFAGEAP